MHRKLKMGGNMSMSKDSVDVGSGGFKDDTGGGTTNPNLAAATEPRPSACDQCKNLCKNNCKNGSDLGLCPAVCAFSEKDPFDCEVRCSNLFGFDPPTTLAPPGTTQVPPTTADSPPSTQAPPTTTTDGIRDDTGGSTNPPLPNGVICDECIAFCEGCVAAGTTNWPMCQQVCGAASAQDCETQCAMILYPDQDPGDIRDDTGTNPNIGPTQAPDYCFVCEHQCNTCSGSKSCDTMCDIADLSDRQACSDLCAETLHLPWGGPP